MITTVHSTLAHDMFLVPSFLPVPRARSRPERAFEFRPRPAAGGCETRRAPRLRCAHTRTATLTTHRTHRQTHSKRLR